MIAIPILILSFLGLLFGILIAKYTKEELKAGRKYFVLIKRFLLILMCGSILFYFRLSLVPFILGLIFGYFFREMYFYFGLATASSVSPSLMAISALPASPIYLFFLLSSFVFLFGLPHGSLVFMKGDKEKRLGEIAFSGLLFFIGISIAYFISFEYLMMFCCGAFLINAFSRNL